MDYIRRGKVNEIANVGGEQQPGLSDRARGILAMAMVVVVELGGSVLTHTFDPVVGFLVLTTAVASGGATYWFLGRRRS